MIKALATLCFAAALLLTMSSKYPAPPELSSDNAQLSNSHESARNMEKKARPYHRNSGLRQRAVKLSNTSKSALHEAAGLQLESSDLVHWDAEKFAMYLRNIKKDDAHQLIKDLLASNRPGARLDTEAHPLRRAGTPWGTRSVISSSAYNSKFAVLGGVLAELASRDFVGTLSLMDSFSNDPKKRFTDQYLYESILEAGSSQDPEKAWETYMAKCSTPFG